MHEVISESDTKQTRSVLTVLSKAKHKLHSDPPQISHLLLPFSPNTSLSHLLWSHKTVKTAILSIKAYLVFMEELLFYQLSKKSELCVESASRISVHSYAKRADLHSLWVLATPIPKRCIIKLKAMQSRQTLAGERVSLTNSVTWHCQCHPTQKSA